MTLDDVSDVASKNGLAVLGAFHLDDGQTLVLLGPDEPVFWEVFTSSNEYNDQQANAMDRWSKRIIDQIADKFDGDTKYPFGGPPYNPFIDWALKTKRIWNSPVALLVHDTSGLFVSFRGAIILNEILNLPATKSSPCEECAEKPCLSACPAAALDSTGYDVPACHRYLDSDAGDDCLLLGCQVRRSCPVGQGKREPAQSAFHMRAFHKGQQQ